MNQAILTTTGSGGDSAVDKRLKMDMAAIAAGGGNLVGNSLQIARMAVPTVI